MKLKVGIIEDNEDTRDRYQSYLNNSEILQCEVAVTSVESFLKFSHAYSDLDLLLLDINLPGMSGLAGIPKIKHKLPQLDIVMLTMFSDDDTIFKALRLGAIGYLLKDTTQKELETSLSMIKKGGAPISPIIAKKIVNYFSPPKSLFSFSKKKEKLTRTQKIILHHLIQGLTYQEIADHQNVSINSVRTHIKAVYAKLQINSRVKLMKKYKDFDLDDL
jgi:DNA-binding NarL/FixJ family response regulator